MTNTTFTRATLSTTNNALGLKEWDLVQTAGKGIGIVLRKKSLNDELVIYSMSSAVETHPNDDDGMAKVRRYNVDGTIATTSETTGRKLKNRDIYTITGIKSYVNPVLAMKDFINQNEDIEFEPVVIIEEIEEDHDEYDYDDYEGVAEEATETTAAPTQNDVMMQMLAMLAKIDAKLDRI